MAGHLEVRLNLNMDFLKIRDLTVSGSLPADNASSPSVTSGGAYMYRNSGDVKNACSNRFLVWKVNGCVLELSEWSFKANLRDNIVRLHFPSNLTLKDLGIFEVQKSVTLVCSTDSCVYCMFLEHPVYHSPREQVSSILSQLTQYSLNKVLLSVPIYGQRTDCVSALDGSGSLVCSLPSTTGSLLMIHIPTASKGEGCFQYEIQVAGMMQRLWSGLTRSADTTSSCEPGSTVLCSIQRSSTALVQITRDFRLNCRICKSSGQYSDNTSTNLYTFISASPENETVMDSVRITKSTQFHEDSLLSVYATNGSEVYLLVLKCLLTDARLHWSHVLTFTLQQEGLHFVSMALTSDRVCVLFERDGVSEVYHGCLRNGKGLQLVSMATQTLLDVTLDGCTVQEGYANHIFSSKYSLSGICHVLESFNVTVQLNEAAAQGLWWLKEIVIRAVENEVHRRIGSSEIVVEDYVRQECSIWKKFLRKLYALGEHKHIGVSIIGKTQLECLSRADSISLIIPSMLQLEKGGAFAITTWIDSFKKAVTNECWDAMTNVLLGFDALSTPHEEMMQSLHKLALSDLSLRVLHEDAVDLVESLPDLASGIRSVLKSMSPTSARPAEMDTTDCRSAEGEQTSLFFYQLIVSSLRVASSDNIRTCLACLILLGISRLVQADTTAADLECGSSNVAVHELDLAQELSTMFKVQYSILWLVETKPILPEPSALGGSSTLWKTLGLSWDNVVLSSTQEIISLGSLAELIFYVTKNSTSLFPTSSNICDILKEFTAFLHPGGSDTLVAEVLLYLGQYDHVHSYCRQVSSFVKQGKQSLSFLNGLAYLVQGSFELAYQLFVASSSNFTNEPFLAKIIGTSENSGILKETYFNKIFKLFELYDSRENVIPILEEAINDKETSTVTTDVLWSTLFKYHLDFEHFSEAHSVVMATPNRKRRLDALRHFVNVLLDDKKWTVLCGFHFLGLEGYVAKQLELKARNTDILGSHVYEAVYSFFVSRKNYKKGAAVMYEYALRLSSELEGLGALSKQLSALSASLTTLQLLSEESAWICAPPMATNIRPFVITVDDIRREYVIAKCRLLVSKRNTHMAMPILDVARSARETLALLVNSQDFSSAFTLANTANLSKVSIFEGLAQACFRQEGVSHRTLSAEGLSRQSLFDQKCNILRKALHQCRKDEESDCYAVVVITFLSSRVKLPQWLEDDFKAVNPEELLKLFIRFGQLDRCVEMIENLLLSYKSSPSPNLSSCLPLSCVDHVLKKCAEAQDVVNRKKLQDCLRSIVQQPSLSHSYLSH